MSVLCLFDLSAAFDTVNCCNDSSVSSACVEECSSSGSVHVCQARNSALWCRSLFVWRALFRKAQSLIRCFSFCTRRILRTGLLSTASLHAYDDTRLCLHFCRNKIASSVSSVDQPERCVLEIGHWMSANRLKLNTDKTELMFASSSHSCATLSGRCPVLQLGADTTVACSHVRLLGVYITSDLSLDHHVSRICAGCYYRLRKLRRLLC